MSLDRMVGIGVTWTLTLAMKWDKSCLAFSGSMLEYKEERNFTIDEMLIVTILL